MSVPTAASDLLRRKRALQSLSAPMQAPPTEQQQEVKAGAPAMPNAALSAAVSPAAPPAPAAPAAPGVQQAAVQQTPTAPAVAAPTPQQTQASSTWQGGAGVPDPRDAQYWADVAKSINTRDVGLAQTQLQEQQQATAKTRALEDLARGHGATQRTLRQQAAAQGRFHGTALGMDLSTEQESYLRSVFRTEEDFSQAMNALALQRRALETGFSVEESAALAASSYRYAQDQMAKQALAAQLAALQPPAEPAPAAAPSYTPQQQAAINSGWTPQQAQGGAGPPGPHYVWSPQQLRWVYTGPSPGRNYYWTGVAWKKR